MLDCKFINKKGINSTLDYETYSSFEGISSVHRIVTAKICLGLYRNKKQTGKAPQYDWSSLANSDVSNQYKLTVRNKFNTLQEHLKDILQVTNMKTLLLTT